MASETPDVKVAGQDIPLGGQPTRESVSIEDQAKNEAAGSVTAKDTYAKLETYFTKCIKDLGDSKDKYSASCRSFLTVWRDTVKDEAGRIA